MEEKIRIHREELGEGDRFSRFRLIRWWDQEKLRNARILIIGAGALGNEIVKNLALLGIGKIFIADLDRIENSNLSRSILFRESDNGSEKALTAARAAKEIFPALEVKAFTGNVVYDLGMGVFDWADAVIAGLDNREARLHINRCCRRLGKTWIDGAIEGMNGVARVFTPESSCYECTMNETDWKELESRRSCALLSREEMEGGRVPTTPTISSIIAGVQCQELVKLLHGMETLSGSGFVFNGLLNDSYVVKYPFRDDCMSHETYENVIETDFSASKTTLLTLVDFVKSKLGSEAVLELNNDVLTGFKCLKCNSRTEVYKSLGRATLKEARCPGCGEDRTPEMTHTIYGNEPFIDKTAADIGIPLFDVLTGRAGLEQMFFKLSADREEVLGGL